MNSEVRKPMDAYLDAVDLSLLKSGASRGQRTGIVRDLESHILDELRANVGEREPTIADVAAVLARLDAPEAFRNGCQQAVPPIVRSRRRLPAHIGWGAALVVTAFIGTLILASAIDRVNGSDFLLMMIASTPVVLMMFMGSALGLAAFRRIGQQPERYWGRFFAVVETAAFSLFLLCASPILFFTVLFTALLLFVVNRLFNLRETTSRLLASL